MDLCFLTTCFFPAMLDFPRSQNRIFGIFLMCSSRQACLLFSFAPKNLYSLEQFWLAQCRFKESQISILSRHVNCHFLSFLYVVLKIFSQAMPIQESKNVDVFNSYGHEPFSVCPWSYQRHATVCSIVSTFRCSVEYHSCGYFKNMYLLHIMVTLMSSYMQFLAHLRK